MLLPLHHYLRQNLETECLKIIDVLDFLIKTTYTYQTRLSGNKYRMLSNNLKLKQTIMCTVFILLLAALIVSRTRWC